MSKDELINIINEKIPEDADVTFSTVTWFDENGVHNWDSDNE